MSNAPFKIAAVMMAFEESFVLRRTLPSLLAAVDQIVIVDMGSTDGSTALYAQMLRPQDLVVCYPRQALFTFGFSHPRNYGAQFAEAQWVLAIDADEWIDPADIVRLREVLAAPDAPAVMSVERLNYSRADDLHIDDLSAVLQRAPRVREVHRRLHRPLQTIRWEGLIHEDMWWDGESAYLRCGVSGLTLHHLNHYKPQGSEEGKTGLYSFLTLRALRYPGFRPGTNPFWLTDYVRDHFPTLLTRANAFAMREGLSPLIESELRERMLG